MESLKENSSLDINMKNNKQNDQSKKILNPKLSEHEIKLNPEKNSLKNSSSSNQNINMFNKNDNNLKNVFRQRQNKISAKSKLSNFSSNNLNKSNESKKDEKKQIINDILGELKLKYNYQLSPNTDLKSFGDLTPGPGQYYNPEIKIGQGQNLRYNNLFKDPEQDLTLKYKLLKDNYYQNKVGPGTYNLNSGYKSYSQNPRTFISKLERGPLFKIKDSVGPGYYNLTKNYNIKSIHIDNNNNIKKKSKNKFILKTEPFFQQNNINIINDNNLNRNKAFNGKISFKGQKNFSWKGISDFSGLGIKISKSGNKEITKDDKIEYKNQEFNFDNQKKLNRKKNKFSKTTKKIILKEISEYNKINKPLIDYVPKDVVLKGNHLPGPCYYNYTNDSIEGDIQLINKKNKLNKLKKWK